MKAALRGLQDKCDINVRPDGGASGKMIYFCRVCGARWQRWKKRGAELEEREERIKGSKIGKKWDTGIKLERKENQNGRKCKGRKNKKKWKGK